MRFVLESRVINRLTSLHGASEGRHRGRRARRRPPCITERLKQTVRRRLRLFFGRTVRCGR
eukprot:5222510-Prymnesium_polylepis.3